MGALASALKDLGIEPRLLLVNAAGFLVLFWLLKRYLFGPVRKVLSARQEHVAQTLDEAEAHRQQMEQARQEYEARIAQIESEARDRIQAAIREAGEIKESIISGAREEAERIVERGRREVEREKEKAMVDIRDRVADLAVEGARQVLERELDVQAHRRLIREFIEELDSR